MNMESESDESMRNATSNSSSPGVENAETIERKTPLKKGPWTVDEDTILVEYVKKHGEGNWNAVQKHTGLARCGKSCRLRWTNHLKPDLKKGAFSPDEERLIVEMHAKMGNKWARMAAELPGRTDNEIKNFWNTRTKRRERAGLPIYPQDLCLQPLNANQLSDPITSLTSVEGNYPPANHNHEFPIVKFKAFDINKHLRSASLFPDFIPSKIMPQDLQSCYPYNDSLFSIMGTSNLLQSICPPRVGQIQENPICSPAYNINQDSYSNPVLFSSSSSSSSSSSLSNVCNGSHAIINGNSCSSEPAQAMKLELPSLQTVNSTWIASGNLHPSQLPSFESNDVFTQALPSSNHTVSTVQNSGLLDAVIHGSQDNNSGILLDQLFQGSSSPTSNSIKDWRFHDLDMSFDMDSTLLQDLQETFDTFTEWSLPDSNMAVDMKNTLPQDAKETNMETCHVPVSSSSSSFFSEGTPMSVILSFDEHESVDMNQACKYKGEVLDQKISGTLHADVVDIFFRPDNLLGSERVVTRKRRHTDTANC